MKGKMMAEQEWWDQIGTHAPKSMQDEIASLKTQLSEQIGLTELAKTTSQQFERMMHKQAETIGHLEKVILDHGLTMLNQIGLSGAEADAAMSRKD